MRRHNGVFFQLFTSVMTLALSRPDFLVNESLPTATDLPRIFVAKGEFYLATENVHDKKDWTGNTLNCFIRDVDVYLNPKANQYKPANSPYLKIVCESVDTGTWFQIEFPLSDKHNSFHQNHYRSLLHKLMLVDLQDTAVKLMTKPGNDPLVTFINVYHGSSFQYEAKGMLPKGQDAFMKAVDYIRAERLGLLSLNPEWLAPKTADHSLTPSVENDSEKF